MNKLFILVTIVGISFSMACQSNSSREESFKNPESKVKPHGTGDAESIALAVKVMEANGGQEEWDSTRFIQWNFFGSRKHIWDKQTDDLIIEGIRDTFLLNMNLKDGSGTVYYGGIQHTDPDSLSKYLEKGKQMWNNDSYWLLMPFKLRDEGVHLNYLGKGEIEDRNDYHKIEMTYTDVGDTPENKYHIYVDPDNYRVVQWDFFPNTSDEEPDSQRLGLITKSMVIYGYPVVAAKIMISLI